MSRPRLSIRTWALVAVAVTTLFLIGMSVWYTFILSGRDWCARALGAAEYANGRPIEAIGGCFALLNAQLEAIAWNSHIAISIIALSLLTLVVIVLAGGRLSFTASATGVSADVGGEKAAAQFVADEAQVAADQVPETAPPRGKVDDPDV